MDTKNKVVGFATRWGLVIAMIGASVGTGNVWRFPRMATLHGQGSFVLAWTIVLFLVSLPILIIEMVMGRASRHGAPGAFKDMVGEKFTWMGTFIQVTMILITAYYTVIMGWCLQYAFLSLKGFASYSIGELDTLFQTVSNGWLDVAVFAVLLLATAYVVSKDISKGIERIGKVMTPMLFVILIVLIVRVAFIPGFAEGYKFLFQISPKTFFSSDTWMAALSQSAWSVGPGYGLVMAMAIYTKSKSDVALNVSMQGLGDNSAALLAGCLVVPALFALAPTVEEATAVAASGNYGLTFISLTSLFGTLQGGAIMSFLFFIALFFAAFTANVAFFLTACVPLIDAGMSKKKAVGVILIPTMVFGAISAYNIDFLNNQDWAWGMALMVGAFFTCFAAWKIGPEKLRTKYINIPENELKLGKIFNFCVCFTAPVMIAGMFIWWTIDSISYQAEWWNPFLVDSTGTFIAQILLVIAAGICLNKTLAKSVKKKYAVDIDKNPDMFPYPDIPKEYES